jgi:predicted transcriptional regulator
MDVILSIKPKYVDAIIKGQKKYEFRKFCFKLKNIENIYIYSTSPIKKIIGSFTTNSIIKDTPKNLWEIYKEFSGLDQSEFFNYFKNKKVGYAIEISELVDFNSPIDPREIIPGFTAPLSFCYIDSRLLSNLKFMSQVEKNYNLNNFFRSQPTILDYVEL